MHSNRSDTHLFEGEKVERKAGGGVGLSSEVVILCFCKL
jgi:hypothetical protein